MKPRNLLVEGELALVALLLIAGPIYGDELSKAKNSADRTLPLSAEAQPYLGVGVAPLPAAVQAQLSDVIGAHRGVLIEHVIKGSPADQAGLRLHDIIITFDNQDVASADQLAKLVKNSKLGNEVILGYVRGGRMQESKVMAGQPREETKISASEDKSAANRKEGRQPERERQRQNDPRPWATFKSMTITKLDDGQYQAEIQFHDKDKTVLHREYAGTRDDIRRAIAQDKDLPADEREHLLRSLDQQSPGIFRFVSPKTFRDFLELNSELFDWPDEDF